MKSRLSHWAATALVASALSVTSLSFAAGTDYVGKISHVRVDADGRGLLYFGPILSGADCRESGLRNVLAFTLSTQAGRALYQLALTQFLAGIPIHVFGTGDCSIYGAKVAEDLQRIDTQ